MDNSTIQLKSQPQAFEGMPEYPEEASSLGKYENLTSIGTGGSARVFKAFDPGLGRCVALKVLKKGINAPDSLKERFKQEIKLQANLDIPGIVRIFECGNDKDYLYYTMELVDGLTIDDYIVENKLSVKERIKLIISLGKIVASLHKAGFRHRDIKPHNVMIDRHDQVKLMDFGLVKASKSSQNIYTTRIGETSGTPAFMAPEQTLSGEDETEGSEFKSDVYSLGVLTYELLTGHLPYDIDHLMPNEAFTVIRLEPPIPMKEYAPDLPAKLEKCIFKCLEKNAVDRPTAQQFADDLEDAIMEKKSVAHIFAVCAVIAIAGVIIFVLLGAETGIRDEAIGNIEESEGGNLRSPSANSEVANSHINDSNKNQEQKIQSSKNANRAGEKVVIDNQTTASLSAPRRRMLLELHADSAPEELKGEWMERKNELAESAIFAGKGALLYRLPENTILKIRQNNTILFRIDSRLQKGGCIYRKNGQKVKLELKTKDQIDPVLMEWNPTAGKVDVLF